MCVVVVRLCVVRAVCSCVCVVLCFVCVVLALLTCKSFDIRGERGESHSFFPSAVPQES